MKTLEAVATVTEDGKLTVELPPGLRPGPHKVRLHIEEDLALETKPAASESYKGRPLYTDKDRERMKPTLPPENEWVEELLSP